MNANQHQLKMEFISTTNYEDTTKRSASLVDTIHLSKALIYTDGNDSCYYLQEQLKAIEGIYNIRLNKYAISYDYSCLFDLSLIRRKVINTIDSFFSQ